jgi:hypothetical protein
MTGSAVLPSLRVSPSPHALGTISFVLGGAIDPESLQLHQIYHPPYALDSSNAAPRFPTLFGSKRCQHSVTRSNSDLPANRRHFRSSHVGICLCVIRLARIPELSTEVR